jgi:hypothetical protein
MRAKGYWPDCTAEDIAKSADTIDEVASWMYDALAYLGEDKYYYSLDDVKDPQEGQHVYIRGDKIVNHYLFENGKWVDAGCFYTYC